MWHYIFQRKCDILNVIVNGIYIYQGKQDILDVIVNGELYLSRENGHNVCQSKWNVKLVHN